MLDFYLISDEQPNTSSAKQLEHIGDIEWEAFEAAQAATIIEAHCDYYEKFRWSSQQVRQKLAQVHSNKSEEFDALRKILQRAMEMNCGLIAFGD